MQNFIFLKGFFLSLSLIMAIGAQNAFVLRQGIAKNNVFYVCLVCFLCDFVLILAGIFGVGEVIAKNLIVNVLITALGILFVSYYAITALISAFSTKNSVIFEIEHSNFSIKKTIILTLCITLLNPHVYLDTVFVVGACTAFQLRGNNAHHKLCIYFSLHRFPVIVVYAFLLFL